MKKRCCYYKHGSRSERKVALTFDDGPNPPRTEQILAILREAGVHATFFVMGKWAERFPETVRRMVAEGHLVGNHGYAGERQLGDADEAEAVIGHITGQPCQYLRAHCFNYAAFFNAEVPRLATSRVIDADVDGDDWKFEYNGWPITTPDEIVRNVLESPQLGPGSIIVLHDGSESSEARRRLLRPLPTIAALPRIIAGLRERGLEPVRVDEMQLDEPLDWTG